MFLCQPVLDRPLPHSQPFGNGSCRKTCLFEREHLLIACFTCCLAGPTGRRENGKGFGWHRGFASSFGQVFPAPRHDCIQMFRQIFRDVPAIGHVLSAGKGLSDSGSKLTARDLGPRW